MQWVKKVLIVCFQMKIVSRLDSIFDKLWVQLRMEEQVVFGGSSRLTH